MPNFRSFHARIKVDGEELPEYDVQVDENEKRVTCWIPSEAGKNFSVCCSNTETMPIDTPGRVTLDGRKAGGGLFRKGKCIRSYCRISPTKVRDFSFSSIIVTDDDALLDTPTTNFGEISFDIWTFQTDEKHKRFKNRIDPAATSNIRVHERSKKAGTHCIRFGDSREVPSSAYRYGKGLEKLVTFIFRYRPLAILQASGVAPRPLRLTNAEQNDNRDVLEIVSSDEEEINERVKKLKDELKHLESRRIKKIKVKTEPERSAVSST